ncbi:MAG: SCP2 sterol-binding domain-containing protein [Pseudomonadota bacterium]|nr:SCP2 sterol-binding domain-containing protein [Pseudomonadota bacterium]
MSEGTRIPNGALAAFERALNRYIALDPEGAQRIGALHGRVICIEIKGFGPRLYLIPGPMNIQIFGDYAGEPDCILRGSPVALARMGVSRRKEDQLFSGEVEIEGDTHLAQEFGDLIAGLEVDWEEQLSKLIGDPAAHLVGSRARAAGRWGRRSANTLAQDVKEYLQEEGRLLPTRYEIQGFLDDIDQLRDDVERLDARIERLVRRTGDSGADE